MLFDLAPFLPAVQAVTTGGGILVLLWVLKNLLAANGLFVPRWTYDREEKRANDAEERADRTLDLSEAAIKREEKRRSRSA